MQVSLARALKLRKRIVEKISQLRADVKKYNRVMAGTTVEIDVKATIETISKLVYSLKVLKLAMFKASEDIRYNIFSLSENKSEISFLKELDTNRGKDVISDYFERNKREVEYAVSLTKADVDQRVKELEKGIDVMQDEIDKFNAVTIIEVNIDESIIG